MLLTKNIITKWNPNNKKHYESKGYIFTKWKNEFEIKVEDLTDGSHVEIDVECDNCGKLIKNVKWMAYKRYVKEDGKYYCNKCAHLLFSIPKGTQTKLKNGKTFKKWCINNNRQDVLDRWDYKLNDCNPSEILYATNKKYYLRCPKGIHESELKNISSFTNGYGSIQCKQCNSFAQWGIDNLGEDFLDKYWDYEKNNKLNINPWKITHGINEKVWIRCQKNNTHGSYDIRGNDFTNKNCRCPICSSKKIIKGINDIATTHLDYVKYFVNKDDSEKYSYASHKRVSLKCPDCKKTRDDMKIATLIINGFSCSYCGDGISYPEKFISNLLYQLNLEFIYQLSIKNFLWCDKYRYDFYIPSIDCIVEIHGLQHYKEIKSSWWKKLKEEKENDKHKKELAKNNNIKNYMIIDCSKSDMDWIKHNIISSELLKLLNFEKENINWLRCHEYACNSLVKVTCDLWNSGIKNTLVLANQLKLSRSTIGKYLKQGEELEWCNYKPKEQSEQNYKQIQKQVICLTTKEIFNSITQAGNKYNINRRNITACCKNRNKSAGKHPETGEKLVWMYYEDYIKEQNNKTH